MKHFAFLILRLRRCRYEANDRILLLRKKGSPINWELPGGEFSSSLSDEELREQLRKMAERQTGVKAQLEGRISRIEFDECVIRVCHGFCEIPFDHTPGEGVDDVQGRSLSFPFIHELSRKALSNERE